MMKESVSDTILNPDENAKCWMRCWEASIPETDLISDETQALRWNRRSGEFGKGSDENRKQKKTEDFFTLLGRIGFSPKGARVLDIGCGPGSLSIPLARAGAEVTALDISSGMLERLKETAADEGLSIIPVECSWWGADIDTLGFRKKFDLVIASMTPGIRDGKTFEQMMACSQKYCYYSNYIKSDPDKIPGEIYIRILGTAPRTNTFASGFMYPFMYLYTLGYRPLVQISKKSVKREQDWLEAAEKAIDHIQLIQDLTRATKEKIKQYYKDISINGRFSADYEMYIGMMAWTMDNRVCDDPGETTRDTGV
jgi:SAM-dependent methyltransferase